MCFNCKLTLTLSEESDKNNILKEETYSSQVRTTMCLIKIFKCCNNFFNKGMWKEIKLFMDNVQVKSTLFISTIIANISNNQSDLFWHIDPNMRECHDTGKTSNKRFQKIKTCLFPEYRMIKSTRKLKCQLMSNEDHDVISLNDDEKPTGESYKL
jgi:hypothetical protein